MNCRYELQNRPTDIVDYVQQNSMLNKLILYLKESGVASLHNANKHCLRGEIIGVPPVSLCNLGPIMDSKNSKVPGRILNQALIHL